MSKPIVNQATCIGCGTCLTLCPNTFLLKEYGKAYATDSQGESEEQIQKAINVCPVAAISWSNS